GTLHDRLMEAGSRLVTDTVDLIIQRNVELRTQRSFIQGSEELHPAPKLTRELCHIDWNAPSEKVRNLIRGLSPYPAAYTELVRGEERLQMKIYSASIPDSPIPGSASAAPGTVLSDGKTYLAIATADGALCVGDLQLSGKKRMEVEAFLLGFREPQSWKCE
ncbi:MAG: methionyl-tRNA formyltransferase, partial [Bacteroidales bacterium]|nr:methionyl-tRNA formyltransferase [Bacteroidales bacterium]